MYHQKYLYHNLRTILYILFFTETVWVKLYSSPEESLLIVQSSWLVSLTRENTSSTTFAFYNLVPTLNSTSVQCVIVWEKCLFPCLLFAVIVVFLFSTQHALWLVCSSVSTRKLSPVFLIWIVVTCWNQFKSTNITGQMVPQLVLPHCETIARQLASICVKEGLSVFFPSIFFYLTVLSKYCTK